MPDYSNENTRTVRSRLVPHDYPTTNLERSSKELVSRGPIELDNGPYYMGQWNDNGTREGKGR